jgi:diguanylate cyclase (GGDEF)-like protein
MLPANNFDNDELPLTLTDLQDWVRQKLQLPAAIEHSLLTAIEAVFHQHERAWQEANASALRLLAAVTEADKESAEPASINEDGVGALSKSVVRILRELTDRSRRDPKTHLVNFEHFMHQLESFLVLEQRGQWCAVGLADVNAFKHYNDTLGHLPGDRILERVATLLREHVRSNDLLAHQSSLSVQDLHARFGGDEFCFLISNLSEPSQAYAIAERFRAAVEHENWKAVDDRLAGQPIRVDVGVACLWLGNIDERRRAAGRLSASLIERADALMYEAKGSLSRHIHGKAMRVDNGVLVDLVSSDAA